MSRAQLLDIGWSYEVIAARVQTHVLTELGAGVYSFGHASMQDRAWHRAALLAAGDGSAISHWTALTLWGLTDRQRPTIHVSTMTRNRRGRLRGVEIHRPRRLREDEITVRKGVRLTSIFRTLWDVTRELSDAELRRCIELAITTHHVSPVELRRYARRRRGLPGSARLAAAADAVIGPVELRSALETAFRSFCEERGFPTYEANVPFERWKLDAYWHELGVAAELDWYRWHGAQSNYRIDRRKGMAVERAGIRLLRIAGEDLDEVPDEVDATLRVVLEAQTRRAGT